MSVFSQPEIDLMMVLGFRFGRGGQLQEPFRVEGGNGLLTVIQLREISSAAVVRDKPRADVAVDSSTRHLLRQSQELVEVARLKLRSAAALLEQDLRAMSLSRDNLARSADLLRRVGPVAPRNEIQKYKLSAAEAGNSGRPERAVSLS